MRWMVGVTLATVLMAALAGCSGKDGGEAEPTTSSSATTSASTNTTAPAPNQAPTATLAAVANGTFVQFNLTGSDADGDALTWTLAFGDGNATNGTTLPTTLNHTFAAAGNYSVNLTVSDGTDSTVATQMLNLTGLAGANLQPVVLAGHADVPDPYGVTMVYPDGCALVGIVGSDAPEGTFGTRFDIGDGYTGWSWAIAPDADFTTMWWGGGEIIGYGPTGTVPEGVEYVEGCAQPPSEGGDFTITLTPPA